MAETKKKTTDTYPLWLPKTLVDALDTIARRDDRSRSAAARVALREYVSRELPGHVDDRETVEAGR